MQESIWKKAGKELLELLKDFSVINLDSISDQRKPKKAFKERREHWNKGGRKDRLS